MIRANIAMMLANMNSRNRELLIVLIAVFLFSVSNRSRILASIIKHSANIFLPACCKYILLARTQRQPSSSEEELGLTEGIGVRVHYRPCVFP